MARLTLLCSGALLERDAPADEAAASFAVHGAQALEQALRSTALPARLRRARVTGSGRDDGAVPRELPAHAWLRETWRLPAHVSLAGCSAHADDVQADWRVTPCHLHVGLDHLVLTDPDALALERAHADALAASAAPLLADEGLVLDVRSPMRWYLRGDALGELAASESALAIGRSIDAYLPRGEQARRWRRIETLLQMAWYEHTANAERESIGLPAVNSLWNEGRIGRPAARPVEHVWGADTALEGLARAAGASFHALDDAVHGHALRDAVRAPGDTLVVLDDWFRARVAGDVAAWQRAWAVLDAWVDAAARDREAQRGRAAGDASLRIVLAGERRWVALELARRDRWVPWRTLDLASVVLEAAR